MTTPELPETAPAPAATPTTPMPERRKGAWRRPGAVIAVVALALLGWQWLETRQRLSGVQEELAKRLADGEAVAKESRVVARNAQEELAVLQAKTATMEARLAELEGQQASFDTMHRELARSNEERVLSEVEQAVAIAAQQLRLTGNVEAALIGLSSAELRLAKVNRPQFANLRKLIQRDIERLKAQPGADVPALAGKLEGVMAVIDTLPLAYERRPAPEPARPVGPPTQAGFWQALAVDFWNDLRQLVRVERVDSPGHADPGLLSPSQSFFLRENLKLRLMSARLALLTRDGHAFRQDMTQAAAWVERYFDGSAKPVQTALATLRALQATDVGSNMPGLNETLDAVRNIKLADDRK